MEPQQTNPADYLDQISAKPEKPPMNNRFFFGAIGAALVLIVIAVVMIFASNSSSNEITPEQLGLRLEALQKVSTDRQKNIKDSQLRAINSRVTTQLAGANRDIAEPLKAAKINLKKTSKSLSSRETKYIEELNEKLEDARLNDEFDSTYSREMAYELDTVAIMMKAVRKKSNSKSMKSFIDSSYNNLVSIQKELQDYVAQ